MSEKYSKTPHFPFSQGVTKDDIISYDYWVKIKDELTVFTEKLDGENTCLNRHGVYARANPVPTENPWATYLKSEWERIRTELGDLEIFGENLYAVHSIEYMKLEHYFYVFAARRLGRWLSWNDVVLYANRFCFPVAPVITSGILPASMGERCFEDMVRKYANEPSLLGGVREGLVVRVEREFDNEEFKECVFKWVRFDHRKTRLHSDENWKRAKLKHEI